MDDAKRKEEIIQKINNLLSSLNERQLKTILFVTRWVSKH